MNRTESAKLVAILTAAYPSAQVRPETSTAYAMALADIPFELGEQAVAVLLRTNKFLPTPAEIREALVDAATQDQPSWEQAWKELERTIGRFGSLLLMQGDSYDAYRERYGWTGWSTPEVEEAVDFIGYRNVCMSENSDLPTIRAQFRNCYEAIVQRKRKAMQIGSAAIPASLVAFLEPGAAGAIESGAA